MKKLFIIGGNGQVGFCLRQQTENRGIPAFVSSRNVLDVTDNRQLKELITKESPSVIINATAYTNVEQAEDDYDSAYAINCEAVANMAKIAHELDVPLIHISTDYVFDGQGEAPWQPDDKNYAPQNYYGETKLQGELAVSSQLEKYFIVRIAWVFGKNGKNFIKTMLMLADKGYKELKVVDDQIGTPTYTFDLARLLVDMIQTEKYGYYHATNEGGYISWYDFCCEFYKQYGLETKVVPVTTEEYGLSVAARPFNSRLNKYKLVASGFKPLPPWQDAISRYLKEAKI
jgi:dTDP-4-dehydrorhamnose reductase